MKLNETFKCQTKNTDTLEIISPFGFKNDDILMRSSSDDETVSIRVSKPDALRMAKLIQEHYVNKLLKIGE